MQTVRAGGEPVSGEVINEPHRPTRKCLARIKNHSRDLCFGNPHSVFCEKVRQDAAYTFGNVRIIITSAGPARKDRLA